VGGVGGSVGSYEVPSSCPAAPLLVVAVSTKRLMRQSLVSRTARRVVEIGYMERVRTTMATGASDGELGSV
jgi:hypothetical protein